MKIIRYVLILLILIVVVYAQSYDLTYDQDMVVGAGEYRFWRFTSGIDTPCPSCIGYTVTSTLVGPDSVTISTAQNNNWNNIQASSIEAYRKESTHYTVEVRGLINVNGQAQFNSYTLFTLRFDESRIYYQCNGVYGNNAAVCSGSGSCTSTDQCTCTSNYQGANCETYCNHYDQCGTCNGDGSTCPQPSPEPSPSPSTSPEPSCVFDRCGVCDGDGSTCGEGNEEPTLLTQKSYCSIQSYEWEGGSLRYNITVSTSAISDYTTEFLPWCTNSEVMARSLTGRDTLSTTEGTRHIYYLDMSIADIITCSQPQESGGRMNIHFYIGLKNSKDGSDTYSSACNYHLWDDGMYPSLSSSYTNERRGIRTKIEKYEFDLGQLDLYISTTVNVVGGVQPVLTPYDPRLSHYNDTVCDSTTCTSYWKVSSLFVDGNNCLHQTYSFQWGVEPYDYGLVTANLDVDVCDTVQTPPTEVVFSSNVAVYDDMGRTQPLNYFLRDKRVYGMFETPSCDTYSSIVKLYLECVSPEDSTLQRHVVFDRQVGYYGFPLYQTNIMKDAGCNGRTFFEFTMSSIKNSDKCTVGADWVFGALL
jgi:hypothetical protein